MGELRGDLDLAQEPLGPERRGNLGAEHLEGDAALVAEVPGEVDRGHPAAAELALDRVAIRQGRLQAGEHVRHVRPDGHRLHERRPTVRSSC